MSNIAEVKFGTPLNQKFGKNVIARDLGVPGGYKPGSEVSRELIAFSNIYWAKKVGAAASGSPLGGKPVCVLTSENVSFNQIKSRGAVSRVGATMSQEARRKGRNGEVVICVNPGGEEQWDRLYSAHSSPGAPFIVMNNAYSTTYNLGNKRGYEEAYYVKRISKGWVFRSFPGPWEAYLEKPDGSVELLKSYKKKPELREVATLVREESFKVGCETFEIVEPEIPALTTIFIAYNRRTEVCHQQRPVDTWFWRASLRTTRAIA
jgi:hypothetical protein